jgi:hypothetical protein
VLVRSLLLAAIVVGCDGEDLPLPDAGPEDTGAVADAGPEDSGVPEDSGPIDAGPLPELPPRISEIACASCMGGCSGESCLRNANGELFCADRCDADVEACPEGFTCIDITQGMMQSFCIPPGATCMEGSGLGQRCVGGPEACTAVADHCEGDFHNFGYCTKTCAAPADCPIGYACLAGDEGADVCRPTYAAPAETCARANDGVELPCAVDTDCGGLPGSLCVRSEPRLPGVCALPCAAGCGVLACTPTARGDACLSEACTCHGILASGRDLLAEALEQVGLTRCSALFDVHAWTLVPPDVLHDPYRLSFYDPTHNEPLRAPGFAKGVVADLDALAATADPPARKAARMVERLASLVDQDAIRQAPGAIDPSEPLVMAVADLIREAQGTPDLAALRQDAADVPMDLQLAVATVVEGMARAFAARRNAIGTGAGVIAQTYDYGAAFVARRADGFGLSPANDGVRLFLTEQFGYADMYGGAVDLLDAIADADLERFVEIPTATTATVAVFSFVQATPVGLVGISNGESGVFDPRIVAGDWALLVDLGGDDTYLVGAGGNGSPTNAVSVLIDLDGSDRYGYVEVPHMLDTGRLPSDDGGRYMPSVGPDMDNGPVSLSEVPRQGGARVGTAVAIDLGADGDRYQSLRMSQGSGIFGAGVLVDDGGDDTYLSETVAQGAGSFGIGVLLDLGGSDHRESYSMAQGFAFAKAAGLLYDRDGDDAYLMDPGDPAIGGDPLYFNAQRPGRANSTIGQGFGFGRRADFSDRAFMSGGVGILVDVAGADRYEGSVFAQGGGYWFGTGILADASGDDTYDSLWYGMATGAHYALGLLLEGGGNDVYGGVLPRVNVTICGAHDFTAAFLVDESGDDIYMGSRISLGSGNVNGMAFFADNAGNDQYDVRSLYAIGNAGLLENDQPGSAYRKVLSLGVFLDAAGTDTYTFDMMPFMGVGDDSAWRQFQNDDPLVNEVELGTGLDASGETTLHYP